MSPEHEVKTYPVFDCPAAVRCSNCKQSPRGKQLLSGYAHGNGGWCQVCRDCGRTFHYDLCEDVALTVLLALERQVSNARGVPRG